MVWIAWIGVLESPALAQQPELLVGEPLEVVVKASRKAPDAESSARFVLWMDADALRANAPQSVADALRFQGGVAVQQTTPGQSTIYVRGLSGREVVHLVDGVRVNSTIFRAGNNPQLSLIDPYSLAHLEVVRGPSSVLHGSDALGGVVVGATRLPGYSLDGESTRGSTFSSITSNPLGSAHRVSVEHAAARWAAHLGVTYYGAGDIQPGGGERSRSPRPGRASRGPWAARTAPTPPATNQALRSPPMPPMGPYGSPWAKASNSRFAPRSRTAPS